MPAFDKFLAIISAIFLPRFAPAGHLYLMRVQCNKRCRNGLYKSNAIYGCAEMDL